jgi:hypothetical protein
MPVVIPAVYYSVKPTFTYTPVRALSGMPRRGFVQIGAAWYERSGSIESYGHFGLFSENEEFHKLEKGVSRRELNNALEVTALGWSGKSPLPVLVVILYTVPENGEPAYSLRVQGRAAIWRYLLLAFAGSLALVLVPESMVYIHGRRRKIGKIGDSQLNF